MHASHQQFLGTCLPLQVSVATVATTSGEDGEYFESALRFLVDRGRRAGDPLFSLLIKSSFLGRPRPRGTLLQSLTRNRFGRVGMELGIIFITLPERRGLNARRQVELVERGG